MTAIRARSVKRSFLRTNQKRGPKQERGWSRPSEDGVLESCSECSSTTRLKPVDGVLLCQSCRLTFTTVYPRRVTREDVLQARALKAAGVPHPEIAKRLGRGVATISNINSGHYDHLVELAADIKEVREGAD